MVLIDPASHPHPSHKSTIAPARAGRPAGCPAPCKVDRTVAHVVAAGAAIGQTTGRRWACSARLSPGTARRRTALATAAPTTWHGKQELRAHNRAFDASQLSKSVASAARPPTPPRVVDAAAVRKAGSGRAFRIQRRQQHVPVIHAAPTPQTYDDDSFEFEEAAPTKMPGTPRTGPEAGVAAR